MPAAPKPRMHGLTHVPGGSDPIPGLAVAAPAATPFPDAVLALAATRDLRGYWRLGEGATGPYADSKPAGSWANTPMTRNAGSVALTDVAGALPAVDDDGAVRFNATDGVASDFLLVTASWGSIGANPFEGVNTVAGWIKPAASASTFKGSVFSCLGFGSTTFQGYVLGVQWPARTVFYETWATSLAGPALAADTWAFLAAVHDATSNRVYINGALAATSASVSPVPALNIGPLIGRYSQSMGNNTAFGAVDEVSVWGAALTDAEIATLYTSGVSAVTPGVGTTWHHGAGTPAGSVGGDSDYYLDTATGDIWFNTAGTWAKIWDHP